MKGEGAFSRSLQLPQIVDAKLPIQLVFGHGFVVCLQVLWLVHNWK